MDQKTFDAKFPNGLFWVDRGDETDVVYTGDVRRNKKGQVKGLDVNIQMVNRETDERRPIPPHLDMFLGIGKRLATKEERKEHGAAYVIWVNCIHDKKAYVKFKKQREDGSTPLRVMMKMTSKGKELMCRLRSVRTRYNISVAPPSVTVDELTVIGTATEVGKDEATYEETLNTEHALDSIDVVDLVSKMAN